MDDKELRAIEVIFGWLEGLDTDEQRARVATYIYERYGENAGESGEGSQSGERIEGYKP